MCVQRQEDLPVGEVRREVAGGADRERGLADAGHPADDPDAARRGLGLQLGQFSGPAGERGDVPRQRPARRRNPGARITPPGSGQEPGPVWPGQPEGVSQQPGGLVAGRQVDAPFQVTDRPGAQRGSPGEFFLAQPGAGPQPPQQLPERHHRPLPVTDSPRQAQLPPLRPPGWVASTLGAGRGHRSHHGEYVGILWSSLVAMPAGPA